MGNLLSCDLCDDVFNTGVESKFISTEVCHERYGIRVWTRYRDDIICVFSDRQKLRRFLSGVRAELNGMWILKIEHLSSKSVPMLDVSFSIPSNSKPCMLTYAPYFKPTCNAVPLAVSSSHPKFVHGWPTADLSRLATNSSTRTAFEAAKLRTICGLLINKHDSQRILDCMAGNPYHNRSVYSKIAYKAREAPRQARLVTLVLTYHPRFRPHLFKKALADVWAAYSPHLECIGCILELRVAWRNAGPPLARLLRNTKPWLEVGDGGGNALL